MQPHTILITMVATVTYSTNQQLIEGLLNAIAALGAQVSTSAKEHNCAMTKDEFLTKVQSADLQHKAGTCRTFSDAQDLNAYLLSL